jgi:hypothetical protein
MGRGEAHIGCAVVKTEGKSSLGRLGGYGRMISKWTFKK